MARKTKIDWCDATFNPITGCLHGCEYCYARLIAKRFDGKHGGLEGKDCMPSLHVLDNPIKSPFTGIAEAYPFGFEPTFYRYKLDEYKKARPKTIFVGSMSDVFGDWVPDSWIAEIMQACLNIPQHRYLFLTKNPKRYLDLADKYILPIRENFWYGTTTPDDSCEYFYSSYHNTFVSIEPIMEDFPFRKDQKFKWAIIGAETGQRKGKIIPKKEWIQHVCKSCDVSGIPVFMKSSVQALMGPDFRQEYPWRQNEDKSGKK